MTEPMPEDLFPSGYRQVEQLESRMVGREAEFALLQASLLNVLKERKRHSLTLIGSAGVGKTRLRHAFDVWVDELPEDIYYFKGRAHPESQKIPYSLLREVFINRFQIQASDPVDTVRQKMENGIGDVTGGKMDAARVHFIGQMLGFDFSIDPEVQAAQIDAQQFKEMAFQSMAAFFSAVTAQLPAIFFLEDLHWADDSSLEAVMRLNRDLPLDQRLLILGLARPSLLDRLPGWMENQPVHTRLELAPLSTQQTRWLVTDRLSKMGHVPDVVRELVVGLSEGNPANVEELIRMLEEDGVILTDGETWKVDAGRLAEVRVPETIHGVLLDRVQRLAAIERRTLQQAAIFGRKFWESAVEAMNPGDEAGEVTAALFSLRDREMIYKLKTPSYSATQEYIFKNSLLRDLVYQAMDPDEKVRCHKIAADWLARQAGNRSVEEAGKIADHFAQGRDLEAATEWYRRAGLHASLLFENRIALDYYQRALACTAQQNLTEQFDLLYELARLHDLMSDRAAQAEVIQTLIHLSSRLKDPERQARALLQRARYADITGNYAQAIQSAVMAMDIARQNGLLIREAEACHVWGIVLTRMRDYPAAQERMKAGLSLARAVQQHNLEADFLRGLGNLSWHQGDLPAATAYLKQALLVYQHLEDRRGESMSYLSLGVIASEKTDKTEAISHFTQSMALTQKIGYRHGEALALINLGDVLISLREYETAQSYFEKGFIASKEAGYWQGQIVVIANLADACICRYDYSAAQGYLEQWRQLCQGAGDHRREGEALMRLGLLRMTVGDDCEARTLFDEAIKVMGTVDSRSDESLALCHLAENDLRRRDFEQSKQHAAEAYALGRELGSYRLQSHALKTLAATFSGLGNFLEALETGNKALVMRRGLEDDAVYPEIIAGMARDLLKLGQISQAVEKVEEILSILDQPIMDGAYQQFDIYLTCIQVFQANQDSRVDRLFEKVHLLLGRITQNMSDERQRKTFLEGNSSIRFILDLANKNEVTEGAKST